MDAKVGPRSTTLSASEIADEIAAGEMTCEAVVRDCVARIAARDGVVKAFVNFDPEYRAAVRRARSIAARAAARCTAFRSGSRTPSIRSTCRPRWARRSIAATGRARMPPASRCCAAPARSSSARPRPANSPVSAPPETTNPHNPAHTPGGSSSGSAAAVADFMVPAALGTQTGGSVLRPVVVLRRVRLQADLQHHQQAGRLAGGRTRSTPSAGSARSIDDIALLTTVLRMEMPRPPRKLGHAPRIGVWRTDLWDTAQAETKAAVEDAATKLGKAGAAVRDVDDAGRFQRPAVIARATIGFYERAACMAYAWDHQRERLSPQMQRYIENGHKISRDDYVAGLQRLGRMPRAVGAGVRQVRRAAGALRAGRGAERSRRDRRSVACRRSGPRCIRRP